MAKLTKFTLSPTGSLVYKSTGRLAPDNYVFRKNTVYKIGEDGVRRRVGSLSRKLTKGEAERIAKAERNRNKRASRAAAKPSQQKPSKPSKGRPRQKRVSQPSQEGQRVAPYGDDLEDLSDTDFPEAEQMVKEEFARRVRDAALSVAPPWLQARIQALSTEALWEAYQQDAYIFEVYFKYHDPLDPPHKSDVSMWVYQFVTRIEQFMGVKV